MHTSVLMAPDRFGTCRTRASKLATYSIQIQVRACAHDAYTYAYIYISARAHAWRSQVHVVHMTSHGCQGDLDVGEQCPANTECVHARIYAALLRDVARMHAYILGCVHLRARAHFRSHLSLSTLSCSNLRASAHHLEPAPLRACTHRACNRHGPAHVLQRRPYYDRAVHEER